MEITTRELEWSIDDQLNWQTFLGTQTGSRLLPKVLESAPHLLRGGNTNEILIRSGELGGFQDAIRAFLNVASPAPEIVPSADTNYPSLVDDKAWSDGQKITE